MFCDRHSELIKGIAKDTVYIDEQYARIDRFTVYNTVPDVAIRIIDKTSFEVSVKKKNQNHLLKSEDETLARHSNDVCRVRRDEKR